MNFFRYTLVLLVVLAAAPGCQCGKMDLPEFGSYGDRYLHAESHRWFYLEIHDSGKRLHANRIESVIGVADATVDLGDGITQKLWRNLGKRKNMTLAIIFDSHGLSTTADWIHSYVSLPPCEGIGTPSIG